MINKLKKETHKIHWMCVPSYVGPCGNCLWADLW